VQTDYIERLFRQANTLQLLREPNATLVLSFLKQAFSNGRKSIGQDALTQLLIDFLQNIAEQDAFSDADETQISADLFDRYRNRARNLLRDWESVKKRYLRGDNNAEGVYEYSLTEHVVRAWQWIESLENREFTGTRSRLDDIFEKIRRVVENSREKTDAERIADLEQKQRDLEAEIMAIRAGKSPYKPFDNVRLREEYDGLLELIRALSTDFKSVEGHFERIRTDMLRQQAAQQGSKGMLLGATLDARDALDRTPQGLSFNSFFDELRDPQRQRQFADNVQELLTVLETRQIAHDQEQLLVRLYRHLLGEVQPVLEANRRIADRITRIVAENAAQDRQLLRRRISEVKAALVHPDFYSQNINSAAPFWEIDGDRALIQMPLEKNLKTQADERKSGFALPNQTNQEKPELSLDTEASISLRIIAQIARLLAENEQITLAQLVDQFPLQDGLDELLTYLNIVSEPDNRHFIQTRKQKQEPMEEPTEVYDVFRLYKDLERFLEGPRVIFVQDKNLENAGRTVG
jgi:hypothetical protein